MARRTMLQGRDVWSGAELERSGDWVRTFSPTQLAEIEAALRLVQRRGLRVPHFDRADFPLDDTALLLAGVSEELEDGRGVVRLRGLPAGQYTEDELRLIFWGLGTWLGRAVYQNASGEIMGEVRDESRLAVKTFEAPLAGKVASARARSRSTGPLRWHTDRCDVLALMCARNAREGGVSKIASIAAIHTEMLRRRPDLLEELFQPYWRTRPSDEDGMPGGNVYAMPVLAMCEGKLTSQYSRTYVEQAQEVVSVPRLSAAQDAALDLLAEIADEVCLMAPFAPGDIQLLNNHATYHGRTAYADGEAEGLQRLLLRLWLAVPNSRRLPAGFESLWGSTQPGALRGGVPQPASGARIPA